MRQRVSVVTLGVKDVARALYEVLGWRRVGGVTFARRVRSADEVDAITQVARQARASIGHEPSTTSWGGYSSIVIDPDGHPWEMAYNPGWQGHGGWWRRLERDTIVIRPVGCAVIPLVGPQEDAASRMGVDPSAGKSRPRRRGA